MKVVKRIGIILAIVLALFLGAAIILPLVFKDKLLVTLKQQINENVNATVEFADLDISLFRHFPNLSVRLEDFSVLGKEEFEGVPLAAGEGLDLSVNLWSVINGPIELKGVHLQKPVLNVYVLRNGKANYDIVKADTTATPTEQPTTSSDFLVELNAYSVTDGRLLYSDQTMPIFVEAKGFNHKGSGDFSATIFDLDTETEIDSLTVDYDGIEYLTNARLALDAVLNANLDEMKFTLRDNHLLVNAMHLQADGFVQLAQTGDDITMDLTFSAPENNFKNVLSLIPNAYIAGYEKVKAEGQFLFDGLVKGVYSAEKEQYPAFKLNLEVDNASVQYPDLPLGISGIQTKVAVNSPSSNLNDLVVDIPTFKVKIGNNPIEGRLNLKTPISDPDIDTRINGVLNLAELAQAFPMEGVSQMAGMILADVTAKTRLSTIENQDYANANVKGKIGVQNVTYAADGIPTVKVTEAQVGFNPQNVAIEKFDAKLGQSDIQATGAIDNILAYFSPEKTLKGRFNIRSSYFNADEWMTTSEPESTSPMPAAAPTAEETELPLENFNFDIDAQIGKLDYDVYKMSNLAAIANVTSNKLALDKFNMNINGSDLSATGAVTNLFNFLFYNEILKGAISVNSGLLDINGLMPEETETTTATATTSTASVPPYRFNIDINGNINRLIYDVYNLTGISTKANITEKAITINSFNGKIEGSDITGDGAITNYMEYVFLNDTLRGTLNLRSQDFNLNPFMASDESTTTQTAVTSPEELEPIIIPANINMTIAANMGKVRYTDMVLSKMQGVLEIAEGAVIIDNAVADIFGGKLAMAGGYDTKVPEKPAVNMKFDMQNIDFQQSFSALNTFQALAPIGKFIQGRFNTSLVMDTELGKNMMPNYNTLNVQGFLQTMDAVIKNFKPLETIGDKLNVDFFKTMVVNDTKNWFEIKNGVVELKPVDYTYKDIAMQISGTHSLTQDMNYKIKASIPRALIGSTSVGAAANSGLDFIKGQASKLGLDVASGSHVNVDITLGGSLTNPKVGVNLLGFGGKESAEQTATAQVKEEIAKVQEDIKKEAQEKIDEAREQVKATAQQAADSLKTKANQKAEQVRDEVADKAKEVTEQIGKKAEEKLGEEAKEGVEEIKNQLENFNPFKKKKKDDGGGGK